MGYVIVASLGENFPSWFTIPKNCRRAEMFCGAFVFVIAATLSVSAEIPLLVQKNLMLS